LTSATTRKKVSVTYGIKGKNHDIVLALLKNSGGMKSESCVLKYDGVRIVKIYIHLEV